MPTIAFATWAVVSTNTIRTAYGAYFYKLALKKLILTALPTSTSSIPVRSPKSVKKVSPAHPADQEAQ